MGLTWENKAESRLKSKGNRNVKHKISSKTKKQKKKGTKRKNYKVQFKK